jgi:glucokinase
MPTDSEQAADGGALVLGVDFGGTKTAAAVQDLAGRRLAAVTVDSRLPGESAPQSFARTLRAAADLVDLAAARSDHQPVRRLVAVGACTFGIPFDDRVELAPTIPGWGDIAFGDGLRAAFPGAEVRVATDVKAAALVEARQGALLGCDPGLYVNLGTGLAAALVVGGQVVAGHHGAAGEIAYNLRSLADVSLPAAERHTLEDTVSGRGLGRAASVLTGRAVDAAAAFELADTDVDAGALVDLFVAELSLHVANLVNALDPARVAVGGGLVRSWPRIERGLRRVLDETVPFPPELVLARFPHDAALRGALALAVEAAPTDRHSTNAPALTGATQERQPC